MIRMNLTNPLWYTATEDSIEEIMDSFSTTSPGTDAAVLITFDFHDSMNLRTLRAGMRGSYTEEERRLMEKGSTLPQPSGMDFSIPEGSYDFSQLPFPLSSDDLCRLLLPYAVYKKDLYIRFFKESTMESVIQVFIPS